MTDLYRKTISAVPDKDEDTPRSPFTGQVVLKIMFAYNYKCRKFTENVLQGRPDGVRLRAHEVFFGFVMETII